VLKLLTSLFKSQNKFKIQSFTYYISSPPARSSGYREKQFDKLFYEFINRGYDILNFSAQSSNGEKQSGMWLIFIVQAKNQAASELNLNEIFHNEIKEKSAVKDSIEGLYYIDDKALDNEE
jgi:hypothetical protein